MFVHVTVLLVLSLLLVAMLLGIVWTVFGTVPEVRDRLEMVKTVLIVVGGIGGVVALAIVYRKQRYGEVAEDRERHRLFTDRYVKAAEQLGHAEPLVRVAGVYAMADLADDWVEGRQLCIDVLCAYVRMPYRQKDKSEREVRRTLFRVVRDHLRANERFVGNFYLGRLRLGTGAAMWFTEATFAGGRVNFEHADLRGGKVQFDGASFAGVRYDGWRIGMPTRSSSGSRGSE